MGELVRELQWNLVPNKMGPDPNGVDLVQMEWNLVQLEWNLVANEASCA